MKTSNWKLRSPWIAGQLTLWSILLLGSLFTSLFMHYSSISLSSTLPTITFALNGCGLLVGGFVAGRKSSGKGWLYGGMQGIIYSCTLLFISFLAFDSGMRINPLLFSTFSFGVSAIGGILGINMKK